MRALLFFLAACSTPDDAPPAERPPGEPVADRRQPEVDNPTVVTLTTRDGVALQADSWKGRKGRPGIVLLHMIPPNHDRTSWPRFFVEQLEKRGWFVVVVDRRGAGASKGEAVDAYQGDAGRYDVEAAVKHLQEQGAGKLGIIGASNGTTSMLDYTAFAEEEGLPKPAFLGFMTGGGYTEAQSSMEAAKGIPALFTYTPDEATWSELYLEGDPAWSHAKLTPGGHGTKMFETSTEITITLLSHLDKALR